jgi:hypothetical protein
MVNRFPYSLIRAALCVGTLAIAAWSFISIRAPETSSLQNTGAYAGPVAFASELEQDGLLVVWSFDTADLLGCESPARALRHLQRRFGSQVQLRMIAVGQDPHVVDPFMRRERLTGDVMRVSRQEYRRRFGDSPLPRLQMVRSGYPEQLLVDETWSDGTSVAQRDIQQTGHELLENPRVALYEVPSTPQRGGR